MQLLLTEERNYYILARSRIYHLFNTKSVKYLQWAIQDPSMLQTQVAKRTEEAITNLKFKKIHKFNKHNHLSQGILYYSMYHCNDSRGECHRTNWRRERASREEEIQQLPDKRRRRIAWQPNLATHYQIYIH